MGTYAFYRLAALGVEQAKLAVGAGAGLFHPPQGVDEGRRHAPATDLEIVDGALGLGAVEGIGGDFQFAHAVVLDTKFTHLC